LLACGGPCCRGGQSALDFELSDGRAFVRLADLPKRVTVVNFWRSDCPPCVREMPLLADTARQGKSQVVAIALQRPTKLPTHRAACSLPCKRRSSCCTARASRAGLLARFGNPAGALPYTVVLDAQRRTCARQTGEVTADWLNAAIHRCTRT
jgi:peroxiredoxin